jgi:hypothetical protein
MSDIVYNYTNESAGTTHSFMNEYAFSSITGANFSHVKRYSFDANGKVSMDQIMSLINPLIDKFNYDRVISSAVRGLDYSDYEQDDEELAETSLTEDYLEYVYLFSTSKTVAVSINFFGGGSNYLQLNVVCQKHDVELAASTFEAFYEVITSLKKPSEEKSKVNFICQSGAGGLYLSELELRKDNTFDLNAHYNDDFVPISEHIIESLNKKRGKGIVFLHGKHGTGKTTYLRHLIHSLKKNVIYVSPDMSARVSEPSFLTFLMKHKNSVLIIEDAENVIKTREAGENQAVSNLLNITDGILGDGLNFQIICTFNTGFDNIDPALKRKGRMIAQYEFGNLSREKTSNLVKETYGSEVLPLHSEMSLAEIFNMQEDNFEKVVAKRAIGFTASL